MTNVSNIGYDYIVPSENGNRCDCKWISFEDNSGSGIYVKADESLAKGLCFSAHLHDINELHRASHTCDLPERVEGKDPIFINVDYALMGIGGDLR